MKAVFDLPVAAHRMRNPRGIRRQGADVVAPLTARFCADGPLALDDHEAHVEALWLSVASLDMRVGTDIHRHRFETLQHASRVIGDWIQFYNDQRPHQALEMKTPAEAFALAA